MNPHRPGRRLALMSLALVGGVGRGEPAPVIRVGPGRAIQRVADAARLAVDGSVIEVDAGDYVADVAVWDQARLTIRGVGGRVRLLAAGAHAEGKAIWVVRGGQVTVEGIEFSGVRVPDRNGAGIRLERGHLLVRHCRFLDSETGILTGNDAGTQLDVEASEFGRLGAGDGQSHGLYVGLIDSFRLIACHVHHANVGHLVKSRARWNRVAYNRLTDEAGGRASYELEFPNGGIAEVVGNLVQQAADTHNPVLVSFGAEGYRGPHNVLRMAHNTLVTQRRAAVFVRVAAGGEAVLRNNLLVGRGVLELGRAADVSGDQRLDPAGLVDAEAGDFRVAAASHAALRRAPLAATEPALTPRAEYLHPLSLQALAAPLRLPGAVQRAP